MIRFLDSSETNPYHFHYKLSLHSLPGSQNFTQLPHYHVSQNSTSDFPNATSHASTFLIKSSTTHFTGIIKTDTGDVQRQRRLQLYTEAVYFRTYCPRIPQQAHYRKLSPMAYCIRIHKRRLTNKTQPYNNNLQFTVAANITNTLELTKLYIAYPTQIP